MDNPLMPTTSQLRSLINESLDDAELDAFCLDYFPKVQNRFGRGMRKDEKITLLLDYCRRHSLLDQLASLLSSYIEKNYSQQKHNFESRIPKLNRTLKLQLLLYDSDKMHIMALETPRGGNPSIDVELPFSIYQLKAILKALDVGSYIPKRFRKEHTQALDELGLLHNKRMHRDFYKMVGQKLYQALFSDEILIDLKIAQSNPPAMCQLWFDPKDVMLAQFPWELIHDNNIHLLPVKFGLEITRCINFADAPSPLKVELPLKLLFIRPRPFNDRQLPHNAEKEALLKGLQELKSEGLLAWEELWPPTWSALEERLSIDAFHIIHFDGHGSYARVCPVCGQAHYPNIDSCKMCKASMHDVQPDGYLVFEAEDRQRDPVNVDEFKAVLANSQTKLVVLTSCDSGIIQGTSVFNGIAPGLIQIGIPAVVAMQGSPSADAMVSFVERMYASLAHWKRLPEAVNDARLAIYRYRPACWFMPVVYLRSSDTTYGQLFSL